MLQLLRSGRHGCRAAAVAQQFRPRHAQGFSGQTPPKPMETTTKTAKEIFEGVMANPARKRFGFGKKLAIVNIDVQKAYTSGEFATSYMTDPKQVDYINELSSIARRQSLPVVWTHVAYMDTAADAGIWGTRTNTPDSLQNIKIGAKRGEFDDRIEIHESDAIYLKKMPSCFHETQLQSLLVWHQVDTIVLTGGSTSGCIRASAVESLSRGYRTIVPIECVADKHESYHFANLTDMVLKYADVVPVAEVFAHIVKGAK
jgi:maleamate amidohydrolase